MSLAMKGIGKVFDANVVLKDVDFTLNDGEIHALIGENGAGKTTLMNILGGVLESDSGVIELDGREVRFTGPKSSLDAGIAFIHQELNLVNDLTVYENLFLGRELTRFGHVDRKQMIALSQEVIDSMDVPMKATAMVSDLDASYKQVVEIARALLMKARIIIMDEPTTSLTGNEIDRVFRMMRTVANNGVSIVFISHKLKEVLTICDSYTVLRDGCVVKNGSVSDVTELDLARAMVGHDVGTQRLAEGLTPGEVVLETQDLTLEPVFRNISFAVRKGEVVGFTGLLGDGRSELFQTIFGVNPEYKGRILLNGKPVHMKSTRTAYKLGIGYVPRNRKENGIIRDLTIVENSSIVALKNITRLGKVNRKKEKAQFDELAEKLKVKYMSGQDLITSLSGGNQQKIVLAKWLAADPDIMIFDNPTQGVDVGAKEEIYDIIIKLAREGVAVCVLSGEAQEIERVCMRAYVLYHGTLCAELSGDEVNQENIMAYATGAKGNEEAAQ